MGMLGVLKPLEVGLTAVSVTGIAIVVWACGVGLRRASRAVEEKAILLMGGYTNRR